MAIIIPQETPESVNPARAQPIADETTFGGGPGVAAQNEQMQKIAQSGNELATFEKIRADQTAVQGAVAPLTQKLNQLISDPKTGLPAYQGVNAMQGHDYVMGEFQKTANELAKKLQPDQQGAFNRIAWEHGEALNQHAMAYVQDQLKQHDSNTFVASVSNMTQAASNSYGNPDTVKMFKDNIDKMTVARGKRLGLNPEETQDLQRRVDTNFHESVISQMLNDPNFFSQAKAYFKENKGSMDVESQDRMRTLFDTIPKQQKAEAKAQQEEYYKDNMKQAMLDMFDGKMTLSEAQRRFRNGQLDKSDFDVLETRLSKPDAAVMNTFLQSKPETFNEIRQAQLNGTKSPGEIQRMIAEGAAAKEITPDDGKYLMGINSEKPPTARDKYIQAQADSLKDFGNRYFAETNFFGMTTNKDKTSKEAEDLATSFYHAVDKAKANGEDIDKIRDQILKGAAAKRFPGLGKLDKMPDIVVDIKGRVTSLLSPDQHSGLKPRYKITPVETRETKEES